MHKDLIKLQLEKLYITAFVLVLTFIVFYVTRNKTYLFTAFLFTSVNIIDYYFKKKTLQNLHNNYNNTELEQLKYINFGI